MTARSSVELNRTHNTSAYLQCEERVIEQQQKTQQPKKPAVLGFKLVDSGHDGFEAHSQSLVGYEEGQQHQQLEEVLPHHLEDCELELQCHGLRCTCNYKITTRCIRKLSRVMSRQQTLLSDDSQARTTHRNITSRILSYKHLPRPSTAFAHLEAYEQ